MRMMTMWSTTLLLTVHIVTGVADHPSNTKKQIKSLNRLLQKEEEPITCNLFSISNILSEW